MPRSPGEPVVAVDLSPRVENKRRGLVRLRGGGRSAGRELWPTRRASGAGPPPRGPVADPCFRLGRPIAELPALEGLDRFVELVGSEWPETKILVLGMLPTLRPGSFDPARMRIASEATLPRARSLGVATLDLSLTIPALPEHYCANGAQLSPSGGRLVGAALDGWIQASGVLYKHEPVRPAPRASTAV